MKNSKWKSIFFILLLIIFLIPQTPLPINGTPAQESEPAQKYRVAYCETEPWINYSGTLSGLVKGLVKYKWLGSADGLPYQDGQMETDAMWDWLAAQPSPYIEFSKEDHYTLSTMNDAEKQAMLKRLSEARDLDLIIVMGTTAGKLMAESNLPVPVMVFSTSNAVRSGIVKSEEDSGSDHVWAHMDARVYKRQLAVFYDLFKFKHMGMVYEHSDVGRVYAAVDDAESLAEENGFQLTTVPIVEPVNEADQERYYRDLLAIHQQLAEEVDAYYLTMAPIDSARLPELLKPFYDKNIPVFSQLGTEEVMAGALISVARADFSGVGEFGASNMIKILHGASPRKVPQVYENVPHIALNLDVARSIGYKPPFEILLVADEIYQSGR